MLKIKTLIVFGLLSISSLWAEADVVSGISIGGKAGLTKKSALFTSGEIRFKDNSQAVDQYFGEIGAGYELLNWLNVSASARYIRANDNSGSKQGYESTFKYAMVVGVKYGSKRLKLKHRLKIQNKINLTHSEEEYYQYFRLKNSVNYSLKKIDMKPGIGIEVFYPYYVGAVIDEYRLSANVEYRIKKVGDIELGYQFQQEIQQAKPDRTHLITLGFVYSFKWYSKKEEKDVNRYGD
ncbi:MAG: DUF2490 domain-containing protein [Fibrobacterales bacterium]